MYLDLIIEKLKRRPSSHHIKYNGSDNNDIMSKYKKETTSLNGHTDFWLGITELLCFPHCI